MKRIFWCFLVVLLIAGCTPSTPLVPTPTQRTPLAVTLTPYAGAPSTPTSLPTAADTPTPLPTVTPTPRLHTIRRGEDLFGIALFYGVSLQDLLTANPTTNPYALRIGDQVVIPAAQSTPTIDPRNPPSPTPVELGLTRPDCYSSADGGVWCFALLRNPQAFDVEGVSAVFRLYDRQSGEIFSQTAYPPLNHFPAGGLIPLVVFFPPPVALQFDAEMELLTALPIPPESQRYQPVEITQEQITLLEEGSFAEVSGNVRLSVEEGIQVKRVIVAALALDRQDRLVGIRRWESDEPLPAGQSLPFVMRVYTVGEPIAKVILLAEAIP